VAVDFECRRGGVGIHSCIPTLLRLHYVNQLSGHISQPARPFSISCSVSPFFKPPCNSQAPHRHAAIYLLPNLFTAATTHHLAAAAWDYGLLYRVRRCIPGRSVRSASGFGLLTAIPSSRPPCRLRKAQRASIGGFTCERPREEFFQTQLTTVLCQFLRQRHGPLDASPSGVCAHNSVLIFLKCLFIHATILFFPAGCAHAYFLVACLGVRSKPLLVRL
jgi:hypothetical protein